MQECDSMNLFRRRDLGGACKKKTNGIFVGEFILRTAVRNTSELRPKVSGFPHRFGTFRTPFTYDTCTSVGGMVEILPHWLLFWPHYCLFRNCSIFCKLTPMEEVYYFKGPHTKLFIWHISLLSETDLHKTIQGTNPPNEVYLNCNTT